MAKPRKRKRPEDEFVHYVVTVTGWDSVYGIGGAVSRGLDERVGQKEVRIEAGEYYFKPNVIEVEAGQLLKLMITNTGEAEHEIEIFAKGLILEQILPVGQTVPVYLDLRYPGTVPFICDMPGHLGGGMHGKITVH